MERKEVLDLIKKELEFVDNNHHDFNSTHEGYGVINEEFDELWDEIKDSKRYDIANDAMVLEAVQVAAMAIKFIENLAPF